MNLSYAKKSIDQKNRLEVSFLLASIFLCTIGYYSLVAPTGLDWYAYTLRYFLGDICIFSGTFAFGMSISYLLLRKYPNFSIKIGHSYFYSVAFSWLTLNIAVFIMSIIISFYAVSLFSPFTVLFLLGINIALVILFYNIE